jgi:hypothetical protein
MKDIGSSMSEDVPSTVRFGGGAFFPAGVEVPLQLLPPAIRKYEEGGSAELEPEPAAVKLARRRFKRRKGVR